MGKDCLFLVPTSHLPLLNVQIHQVIMLNRNLPNTGGYNTWTWTGNASMSLEPGPHVVTLCFIGNGLVNLEYSAAYAIGVTF